MVYEPTEYEVIWGPRQGRKVPTLTAAILLAREKAKLIGSGQVVPVWENGLVIAVVTDDADGLTLHRLKTWPEGVEVPFE